MTPATRRRGSALEAAIFEAVFRQIAEVGYGSLTMEGVAAAARTGKAALYRRWPDKESLVRDALRNTLPSPEDVPVHGNVRDDLLALLFAYRSMIDATRGTTFQILKAEGADGKGVLHQTVREHLSEPLKDLMYRALRRGAERGEVRPAAVTRHIAQVGPAMITTHCLNEGMDISDAYLEMVVDEIMLPMISAR